LFQTLEPAFGLLHGSWVKSWEWERGIRSFFGPGAIAFVLKCLETLGVYSSVAQELAIRSLMATLSLLPWWTFSRVAERIGGASAGIAVALILGVAPVWNALAVGTLSEGLTLIAFAAMTEAWLRGKAGWIGAFGAVAVGFRFQSAFLVLGLFIAMLDGAKHRRPVWVAAATASAGGLLLGAIDAWTWGGWFHSAIEYFRFNILEGGAANWFGAAPWHRYLTAPVRTWGAPAAFVLWSGLFAAIGLFLRDRKRRPWLWVGLPFLAVHQWVEHKEDRFLIPVYPMLWAVAVGALAVAAGKFRWQRRRLQALGGVVAILVVLGFVERANSYRWDWNADQVGHYREIARASQQEWAASTAPRVVCLLDSAEGGGQWSLRFPGIAERSRQVDRDSIRVGCPRFVSTEPFATRYLIPVSGAPVVLSAVKALGLSCEDRSASPQTPLYRCKSDLNHF